VAPPNLVADKGRVDSARGLGFLNELANIPLTYASMSVASAYAGSYRCLLHNLRVLWPSRRLAYQSFLDDTLAGVVINPETGELSPDENAIPAPDEVEVSIVSPTPVSIEQRRRDLYDMLQGKVITLRWFRILSRKLGLDLPVANETEWENYRRAMMNNIVLFNDGKTPGDPDAAPLQPTDIYPLHLEVIEAFISRPEFGLAAEPVRTAFYERREILRQQMGAYNQLPNVEDAAVSEQERMRQMQQLMAQGAGPGQVPNM
jgi:hypothetical protein